MRKLVALVTVAAFAALPAAAGAHPKAKAKVYRGSFQLVGADGSYTRDSFGKAQLVDGKRNDQLSVHVRKLGARVKYTFKLQSAAQACTAGAAGGTDVPGWKYRRGGVLFTNRRGEANSWARARGFKVDPTVEYFVGVFDSTNRLVACAQLTKKHKPKKPHGHGHSHKPHGHGHKPHGHKPHGHKPHGPGDKPHGHSNGQGKPDDQGKTVGGDNGQGKDRGRGNDDKPRGPGQDKGHG
jgi:hypothetical protein